MIKYYIIVTLAWIVLFLFSFYYRKRKIGKILLKTSYAIFILLAIEFASIIGFKLATGQWTFRKAYNHNAELFEPHPYLIGMPKKNAFLEHEGVIYRHNSDGFRDKEFPGQKTKKRILAMGGSTTYSIGVDYEESWPYYLDSLLQPEYEVLNLGVPGHSSVEHLIMTEFLIQKYDADLVLIHAGLNDLRNMHVQNLEPDYSNFHAPTLYGSLGFCPENHLPKIAGIRLLALAAQKLGWYPECTYHEASYKGEISSGLDTNALHLYHRNLKNLDLLMRNQGMEVIYLPQVMTRSSIHDGNYRWWAPFVSDKGFYDNLMAYNLETQSVAEADSFQYLENITAFQWKQEHFVDPSHLNAKGNLIFARIIADHIKKEAY